MLMRKALLSVLIATGAVAALALPAASEASTSVGIALNFGPPPAYIEYVPAPRVGYVWVPGYWDWRGHRHVWVAGNWVRHRPGYVYQPSRWEAREGRWYLERGRWDRDHDGVPDHRDRYPNNPYRH